MRTLTACEVSHLSVKQSAAAVSPASGCFPCVWSTIKSVLTNYMDDYLIRISATAVRSYIMSNPMLWLPHCILVCVTIADESNPCPLLCVQAIIGWSLAQCTSWLNSIFNRSRQQISPDTKASRLLQSLCPKILQLQDCNCEHLALHQQFLP